MTTPGINGTIYTAQEYFIKFNTYEGWEANHEYSDDGRDLTLGLQGETEEVGDTYSFSTTPKTTEGELSDEALRLKSELDKLEGKRDANNTKMKKIEKKIKQLATQAAQKIQEAIKEQAKIAEEHEEEVDKTVAAEIQAYIEANKEGGPGMSRQKLASNIADKVSAPAMGAAIALLVSANEDIDEIDGYLTHLNSLIADTRSIESDIAEIDRLYKVEVETPKTDNDCTPTPTCTDPLGFKLGSGDEEYTYEFIVDDGEFDSTDDFLASFEDLAALDGILGDEADGVISIDELREAGINLVKTDKDGNVVGQLTADDMAQEFGDTFSISTKFDKDGTYEGIDTADSDGDGVANQKLNGTFQLNINGESITGYSTDDDTSWLAEKYGIKDASAVEDAADDVATGEFKFSQELEGHQSFLEQFTTILQDLRNDLREAWETITNSKAEIAEEDKNELQKIDYETLDKASRYQVQGNIDTFMAQLAAIDNVGEEGEDNGDDDDLLEDASLGTGV